MTALARVTDWCIGFWLVSNPVQPKRKLTMSDVVMVETSAGVLYWPIVDGARDR